MTLKRPLSRRLWLIGTVALGSLLAARRGAGTARASDPPEPIAQPDEATPQAFIERAFAMKRRAEDGGDQSYGAVVVRDGVIVAETPSRVVVRRDPTAHAEMEAIRAAAQNLGSRDLGGCILYSSSRPCPMCEAAAYWAGIETMVHGAGMSDAGRPRLGRC
jgi:tRNA(Arg) A34 adenosine deaminase TadA